MTTTCGTGNAIKRMRCNLGWSQRDFAIALTDAGVPADASRVSRIESGQADPRFSHLLIICKVLGCTPNDLADITTEAEGARVYISTVLQKAIDDLAKVQEEIAA